MSFLLLSLILLTGSGLAALACGRRPALAAWTAASGVCAACLWVWRLSSGTLGSPGSAALAWPVPFGSFSVELDALSAFLLRYWFFRAGVRVRHRVHRIREKEHGPSWFSITSRWQEWCWWCWPGAVLFRQEIMALASFSW